jgi:trans-aconitate methyltransferase
MTAAPAARYNPSWLELREDADAAARATELLGPLRYHLAGAPRLVVRDLGCGAGSMQRWLAARLPGPQHWIMEDRDADLLAVAATTSAGTAADGTPVTVETLHGDITALTAADLADASLVTASALLDLLTADEVNRLAAACVDAGCPALLTLSVVGRVDLDPADPLDADVSAAFNEHLRRRTGSRRPLGPDAVTAIVAAFERRGATVYVRPSPWRLGAIRADLIAEWLRGWVPAACAARPDLADAGAAYLRRRLDQAASGKLRVTVHHDDLLALPAGRLS